MSPTPAYTKCPNCETMYRYTDIKSDNTSEVECWSDGFCMDATRKDILNFATCPACNTYFWIQENAIKEPIDLTEIKDLENSLSIDDITSQEVDFIKNAFRGGLANVNENEVYLRIKLWQAINHIIRKYYSQGIFSKIKQKFFETTEYKESQNQYNAFSSLKQNNLIRLINLLKLDKDNPDHLLYAEIYRELGDFGKATVYYYKAETSSKADSDRVMILKNHITSKNKLVYKL